MATARIFRSGNSQAVRLPKQFRLTSKEVEIICRGDELVLRKKKRGLTRVFEILTGLPDEMFVRIGGQAASTPQRAMIPPRYLLDTNICIYIRRQQPREVLARFQKLRPGAAVISVITYGELLFGAEKSANRAQALQLLEELRASCRSSLCHERQRKLTEPLEPICKRGERRSAIMISGLRRMPKQRRSR